MKVKKVIEQTKEYNRLQALIDNVKCALENLDKTNTVEDGVRFTWGDIRLTGGILTGFIGTTEKQKVVSVDVTVNSEIANIIKNKFRVILSETLTDLQKEQDALEL